MRVMLIVGVGRRVGTASRRSNLLPARREMGPDAALGERGFGNVETGRVTAARRDRAVRRCRRAAGDIDLRRRTWLSSTPHAGEHGSGNARRAQDKISSFHVVRKAPLRNRLRSGVRKI